MVRKESSEYAWMALPQGRYPFSLVDVEKFFKIEVLVSGKWFSKIQIKLIFVFSAGAIYEKYFKNPNANYSSSCPGPILKIN